MRAPGESRELTPEQALEEARMAEHIWAPGENVLGRCRLRGRADRSGRDVGSLLDDLVCAVILDDPLDRRSAMSGSNDESIRLCVSGVILGQREQQLGVA